jgi:hypothetical protein
MDVEVLFKKILGNNGCDITVDSDGIVVVYVPKADFSPQLYGSDHRDYTKVTFNASLFHDIGFTYYENNIRNTTNLGDIYKDIETLPDNFVVVPDKHDPRSIIIEDVDGKKIGYYSSGFTEYTQALIYSLKKCRDGFIRKVYSDVVEEHCDSGLKFQCYIYIKRPVLDISSTCSQMKVEVSPTFLRNLGLIEIKQSTKSDEWNIWYEQECTLTNSGRKILKIAEDMYKSPVEQFYEP